MSKFDESDYHSAAMQAVATLLSIGVAIVAFANWIKLAYPIYFILSITIFSLIGTSLANHFSLFKINILHILPEDPLPLKVVTESYFHNTHFFLFTSVNLFLGGLTLYILIAAMISAGVVI